MLAVGKAVNKKSSSSLTIWKQKMSNDDIHATAADLCYKIDIIIQAG